MSPAAITRPLWKRLLHRFGVDLSWARSQGLISLQFRRHRAQASRSLPPLYDDPREALFYMRGGKTAAFSCPIGQCVTVNGLSFARKGWHPFRAALEEYAVGQQNYEGSVLEQFYHRWAPATAQQAFIGEGVAPPHFDALPPHLIYLFPWSARTIEEADRAVRKWTVDDHLEHGGPAPEKLDGWLKDQGPIAPTVGAFEYSRLISIFESLKRDGFDRQRGEVAVVMIKRGNELRFLNFGGGLHRTAAMSALGYSHVPARLLHSFIIDIDDIAWWPQVQSGVWPEAHARRYIDHLFDFDSHAWATRLGLTLPDTRDSRIDGQTQPVISTTEDG